MNRSTILAFAFLLLALGQAAAEPPACTGTDLMAKFKSEHPSEYEKVMAETKAIPNGDAIFWKIEHDSLAPSWLLGTAHVTDPRVTGLKPEMQEAFDYADAVALELKEIANPAKSALSALANAKYMVLPPGQTLWDLIPDTEEHFIRNNVNVPPNAIDGFFGYQPWVVAAALSVPLCETQRAAAGLKPLDMQLAADAENNGIPLHGLETMEEQLSVLSGMSMDQQVAYLLAAARSGDQIADQFETLINLYDKRLIAALIPLMKRLDPQDVSGQKVMTFMEQDLIAKRNQTMASRAADLLRRGNVFIAVGALHLPGEEGLVELIRKAGYKVSPVN
jgi:uncharacterized protein YbaP (TraB family)